MSTQPLRPPLRSEHESQISTGPYGPFIVVNGHLISTPYGLAGGAKEFGRARDIIEGTTR